MLTNVAAGDVVYLKAGTYSRTTANDTTTNAGSATSPIVIQGTDSSWVPITPTRTNDHGDLVTTNFPLLSYTSGSWTSKAFTVMRAISATATTRNGGVVNDAADAYFFGCSFGTTSTAANAAAIATGSARAALINCDLSNTAASGGGTLGGAIYCSSNGRIINCRVTASGGNTVPAIRLAGSNAVPVLLGCTIYAAAGHHIYNGGTSCGPLIYGCTLVDNAGTTMDGYHVITGSTVSHLLLSNLITDETNYGILAEDAGCAIFGAYNRLDRNTTGATSGATDWLAATSYGHNTTSAVRTDEYNSPGSANYDYRLKTGSPAKDTGLWGTGDIGALQRPEPTYPTAGNVLTGTGAYGDTFAQTTPTLTLPGAGYVLTSDFGGPATYGVSGTGSTPTATLPAAGYVLTSTYGGPATYGAGGTGSTPTATLTAAANVWYGSGAFGAGGTSVTPSKRASSIENCEAGNVKKDVVIDNVTGTYEGGGSYCAAANVLYGVDRGDGVTGTLCLPNTDGNGAASNPSLVVSTAQFGVANATQGTYPSPAEIGAAVWDDATSPNRTVTS
jgi:hypothetical protein